MDHELTFDQLMSILTDRQLSAYLLWQDGLNFGRISGELGISEETARRKVRNAERRILEYETYLDLQKIQTWLVEFPLTYRELRAVLDGLCLLERDLELQVAKKRVTWDWKKRAQDQLCLVGELIERVESIVQSDFELPEF